MINYFGFKPKPETKSLKTSNNVSGGGGGGEKIEC